MGQAVGFDPDSAVFRVHEGGKLVLRSTMPLTDRRLRERLPPSCTQNTALAGSNPTACPISDRSGSARLRRRK